MPGRTGSAWVGPPRPPCTPIESASCAAPDSANRPSPAASTLVAPRYAAFCARGHSMSTKKIETPQEIYQLKVTLLGTTPPIWRRLLVPADMTLEQLHNVLQLAMGWEDCHMHDFRIGPRRFGKPDPNDRLTGLSAIGNERTARLFNVLGKVGAKAVYTYDFGDNWQHGIAIEKVQTPEPGLAYPVCMGGKRHGPPEDCGGAPGYYHLREALSDPDHKRHEELREWMGDDFDPEAFSVDDVNRRLAPLQSRRAQDKDA